MAMVCDVCGTKFGRDDGQSNLRVSPPHADIKMVQAFAARGQAYEYREPLVLDLCAACTSKILAHLGLATEICELPQLPPDPSDKTEPPAGALTDEDLRQLGLLDQSKHV